MKRCCGTLYEGFVPGLSQNVIVKEILNIKQNRSIFAPSYQKSAQVFPFDWQYIGIILVVIILLLLLCFIVIKL